MRAAGADLLVVKKSEPTHFGVASGTPTKILDVTRLAQEAAQSDCAPHQATGRDRPRSCAYGNHAMVGHRRTANIRAEEALVANRAALSSHQYTSGK